MNRDDMNRDDAFTQLETASDQLRAEILKLLTPALEALNRFAQWIAL